MRGSMLRSVILMLFMFICFFEVYFYPMYRLDFKDQSVEGQELLLVTKHTDQSDRGQRGYGSVEVAIPGILAKVPSRSLQVSDGIQTVRLMPEKSGINVLQRLIARQYEVTKKCDRCCDWQTACGIFGVFGSLIGSVALSVFIWMKSYDALSKITGLSQDGANILAFSISIIPLPVGCCVAYLIIFLLSSRKNSWEERVIF